MIKYVSISERRLNKYIRQFQEMPHTRTQIENEIMSSDTNRNSHLILCYFLPNNDSHNHWQGEIYADILDIVRKKWSANKKYLPATEYFNNLWNKPFENEDGYELIDSYVEELKDDYLIPDNWRDDKKSLVIALMSFYKDLSVLLSLGKVTKQVVFNLIKRYITK